MNILNLLPSVLVLVYLGMLGVGVYCMILFIQLATRGIKALDIYISKENQ